MVASWVGLGGLPFTNHPTNGLLQAGFYQAYGSTKLIPFWENVTNGNMPAQTVSGLTVMAGDTVYVDVSYTPSNGGTWTYYLEDETTGSAIPVQTAQTGISSYYDGTEADWIVEKPGGATYLSDFGSSTFTNCVTNTSDNVHDYFDDTATYTVYHIEMTSADVLANASQPTTTTNGFTDYWHNYS